MHRIVKASTMLFAIAMLAAFANMPAWSAAPTHSDAPAVDVVELTIAQARQGLDAGTLSSRALTQAYLDRIAAIDRAGPRINAVIELNPRALADAAALDAERKAGHVRGPLHGIPVLIKDNIDVAGMVNSAGSLALADNRPARDAFLVQRLRDAGAVILGKTNLSEWANFRSTHSVSGWSSRGGQTHNPYALDRDPCGSSAGTGAGIAASLAMVGIGTETDGSILCPSSQNGLVGLKPTVGLVSRSGIIPISVVQDTAGPMGRDVADVAALLDAMAGTDPTDPAGPASAGHIPSGYAAFLVPGALKGKRFGVLRQAMGNLPAVDAAFERAIVTIKAQGGEVVDVKIDGWGKWDEVELEAMLYEFKDGLNAYLRRSGNANASLADLIAWNRRHAAEAMPLFDQELFEQAQAKGPLTDPAYAKARGEARRLAGSEGLLQALDANRLDAVIAPADGPAWPIDPVLGDRGSSSGYGAAAVAGTPSITVPMGDVRGLPIGLVFMGRAWSEGALLGYAYAFEQATHARRKPDFRTTVGR
jgi:amidase